MNMMNQVLLLGRLVEKVSDNIIKLSVKRPFKDEEEGTYKTDLIDIKLPYGNLAENVMKFCEKDDIIGIRGMLQNNNNGLEIVVEKVSFLSKKEQEEKGEE